MSACSIQAERLGARWLNGIMQVVFLAKKPVRGPQV